jgi:hypothetical protein
MSGIGYTTLPGLRKSLTMERALQTFISITTLPAVPVNEFAQVSFSTWQVMCGNGPETPIYPFGGFDIHPHYDDFTTPPTTARHNLIKGGS